MHNTNHAKTFTLIIILTLSQLFLATSSSLIVAEEPSLNQSTLEKTAAETGAKLTNNDASGNAYPKISTHLFENSLTCEVIFDSLQVDVGNTVSSEGCSLTSEPGKPTLPTKTVSILLPPKTTVKTATLLSLEKTRTNERFVPTVASLPNNAFICADGAVSPTGSLVGVYPEQVFQVNGVHDFRGYRVLSLTFYAAQYDADTQTLSQVSKAAVSLSFEDGGGGVEALYRGTVEDEAQVRSLVVNPDASSLYASIPKPAAIQQTCKYAVVTSSTLVDAFQPLVEWKTLKLGSARTVTLSEIYNNFTGVDAQERIRKFILHAYLNWGTSWVLLGGDTDRVPYRGVYGLVESTTGWKEDPNIPCDLYYSALNGTWNADGDEIYGEIEDDVDLYPEVYVGRAPVSSIAEAAIFVNKILTYERDSPLDYRSKALLIAYWLDDETNGAIAKENIADQYLTDYIITRKYEPYYGADISSSSVMAELNSGYGVVNHNSHGNQFETPPLYYYNVDALSNEEKYFIFYSTACDTNRFDTSDAISEHYILNPNGGAVAYIGNSRYGWYEPGDPGNGPSDLFDREFFRMLDLGYNHVGEVLARSKIEFISDSQDYDAPRWIQFSLNLLGDPEMTIVSKEFELNCQTLDWNGDAVSNATVYVNSNVYGVTGTSGWVNGTSRWTGEVKLEVFWQETKVNETAITLESDTTLTIHCHIWSLQLNTLDMEGEPLQSATVHATFPNTTITLLQPATYKMANGTYWLAVTWQNSTVYGNTSISLDVTDTVLNLTCSVYRVSFANSFKDMFGNPLNPLPTSFRLLFPNGTVSSALNSTSSYLIQNGTTTWTSIIWKGMEVAPLDSTFDAEDGNPVVYCSVDLSPIPEFPFLPLLSLIALSIMAAVMLRKQASKKR